MTIAELFRTTRGVSPQDRAVAAYDSMSESLNDTADLLEEGAARDLCIRYAWYAYRAAWSEHADEPPVDLKAAICCPPCIAYAVLPAEVKPVPEEERVDAI